MARLVLKWLFFGVSMAALKKVKKTADTPPHIMKEQAVGIAKKGLLSLAGVFVASIVLAAGLIIAIYNWFAIYANTGSFQFAPTVTGGIILIILGGSFLALLWPRKSEQEKIEEEKISDKSDIESTIALVLKEFIAEKRYRRQLREELQQRGNLRNNLRETVGENNIRGAEGSASPIAKTIQIKERRKLL